MKQSDELFASAWYTVSGQCFISRPLLPVSFLVERMLYEYVELWTEV